LIKVHKEFEKRELKAKVVLQVHDQLLVECPKRERLIVIRILKECMEWEVAIGQSKVCFPVEISEGPSWGELAPVSVRRKKDKG
jgi:DNA polymerase-1